MENITVCIRMKPRRDDKESTLKVEGNNIYNSKTKEVFAFGKFILIKTKFLIQVFPTITYSHLI